MADDEKNVTQTPSFVDKFSLPFKDLWANHKIFLGFCGVLILIVKFREVLINILLTSAKTLLANTKKQSADLQAQQDEANKQADELVKKAKEAPAKETPSDDDWYKK